MILPNPKHGVLPAVQARGHCRENCLHLSNPRQLSVADQTISAESNLKTVRGNAEQKSKGQMIGVDLFSGAGGMSLGAQWAGVNVKVAVEANTHAAKTF